MKVLSSHIDSAEYDDAERTLYVTYKNGAKYSYAEVPAEKWEAFQAATSKGEYLRDEIKPKHPTQIVQHKVPTDRS